VKRLGALIAAVALIAGAWALRDAIDGDDGGNGGDTGNRSEVPDQLRLRCATSLGPVCDQIAEGRDDLDVEVEDPGITADALAELPSGEDPGFDAWLTDGPWAAMVADDREFAGAEADVLGTPSDVLGRSPAVLVIQSGRETALTDACGGTITWRCVGEQSDSVRIGLSPPDRGDGLVPLAEAVGGYFDAADYSASDFNEPGFAGWFDSLTNLARSTPLGDRSALATAVVQAGTFNVVGALEAQSATQLRDGEAWSTIYPEPMTTADVQLVPRGGLPADDLLDRLDRGDTDVRSSLVDQGWRPATGQGDPDVAIPENSNLPSAGVLNALRDLW